MAGNNTFRQSLKACRAIAAAAAKQDRNRIPAAFDAKETAVLINLE
jgi:hypothetical protein